MKKKSLILPIVMMSLAMTANAQRTTDRLDRGTVAVKTTKGVFVSWRIQSDEYYDVTYNLYRNGTKIAEGLTTSNYTDTSGSTSNTYEVAAVVRGQEQAKSKAVTPWSSNFLEITPKHHSSLTSTLIPNDACVADVDGDGEVEILMKYNNREEISAGYPKAGNNGEYTILEVLKLDGTVLWWVNCGPNMGDFQNNTINIVGYDWDQDGKAEVVLRLVEGATIHKADGTSYVVGADGKNGTSWTNSRQPKTGGTEWFTYYGKEFLFYLNGETGNPYDVIDYPNARLEPGETSLDAAWGDGYGHRAGKYYFGAPYLDGRKPSIFVGRGIYTRHKFTALDVDPTTHKLTQRWKWTNNQKSSPWYGQGYHNFGIADVDMDGRDEIVWGSMVIDDNGKGLSTTGLGHGDAQHHGDFDPYTFGLEGFFCNESSPANNYRDLTTSKIYHRYAAGGDDGRAIAGNFSNDMPGAMGFSAHENAVSCVTGNVESGLSKSGIGMNFTVYWDGDLQEETYNGGDNTVGSIQKYKRGVIEELTGSLTNNSTKATPSLKGDILGDWREEFIVRTPDHKIRIYTTTYETPWRNYSLWYDHQHRNGIVWQSGDYNQPQHLSYFLGELEGITVAPPSLSMNGKTEIANGGTISSTDAVLTTVETNDMTVALAKDATPYIYIDNAPTWTQGSAPSEATAKDYAITTTTYTHTLTGGNFAGDTRVVKQGSGVLVLPATVHTHTGNTDVWEGTLQLDGTLQNSPLWLNRHTTLQTTGGTFAKGIKADYNATVKIGSASAASTLTADSLSLGFGSAVELDLFSDGLQADQLNLNLLSIEKKVWPNGGGPVYDTPVFRFISHKFDSDKAIADGKYCLGTVGQINGNLSDIVIEGFAGQKVELTYEDGKLYIDVLNYKGEDVTWIGGNSNTWNLDTDANFKSAASGETVNFVTESAVTFDDSASSFTVNISGQVMPRSIVFDNTKAYTITGDSIVGEGTVTKNNTGTVNINNVNRVGNTTINRGVLNVASLANTVGNDYGSLGDVSKTITLAGGTLGITSSTTNGQTLIVDNGIINVASGQTLSQSAPIKNMSRSEGTLTKAGSGSLNMPTSSTINTLVIQAGTVNSTIGSGGVLALANKVEFRGGSLADPNAENSYDTNAADFIVAKGQTGKLTLDPRCNYTGSLTGAGTFTVVAAGVRNYLQGDWSEFEGELVVNSSKRGSFDPSFDWDNTYGLPYATLNVPTGQTFNNNGKTVAIKALKGSSSAGGTLSGTGTYIIGENNTGNITSYCYINSPVIYRGQEGSEFRITTSTAGRINANLTVESGALRFTGSTSNTTTCNGSKVTYVTNTGKVYGTNSRFYAVNASNGGTLSVTGTNDAPTTVTLTNGVSIIGNGGVADFKIRSTSSASKLVAGMLSFRSGSVVRVRLDDTFTPAIGNEFTLIEATTPSGFNANNVTLELPELPAGMAWDTTDFFSKTAVIKIVKDEATGIGNLSASAQLVADVYTVDGVLIGRINATKASLHSSVKTLAGKAGNYVVRFVSGTSTDNLTVSVK